MSRKLIFLNCPIELIERQYGGTESVWSGINYLKAYFEESNKTMFDYQQVMEDCQKDLAYYHEQSKNEKIKSRAIRDDELQELLQRKSKNASEVENALFSLVVETANADTTCFSKRYAFGAAYILGGSVGVNQLECFTPLGRHFSLSGPSLGYGVGAMLGLTWHLSDRISYPGSWHIALYEQQGEPREWYENHFTATAGLVSGVAMEMGQKIEQQKRFDPRDDLLVLRPFIGGGAMIEHTHSMLRYRNLSPLYLVLSKVVPLKDLAAKLTSI